MASWILQSVKPLQTWRLIVSDVKKYSLIKDRKGLIWDALLYVPTVIALLSIGIKFWYGPNQNWAYVLFFMSSFFFIVGANRILSSRLMLLPNSPVGLEVGKSQVSVQLKSERKVDLIKNVKFFPDYAGKSFGLTGMDLAGKRRQFVLHRGQFDSEGEFKDLRALLNIYK